MTETLHCLGLKWVRRVNLELSIVGQINGDYVSNLHIAGRTGQESGYYVDMPNCVTTCINDQGDTDSPAFNASTFLDSAMEHGVIEQSGASASGTAAASTVKCLVLANDGGQKIFRATSDNYNSIVGQLQGYSPAQTGSTGFGSYINKSFTLLLQQSGTSPLNQWKGFGYAADVTSLFRAG